MNKASRERESETSQGYKKICEYFMRGKKIKIINACSFDLVNLMDIVFEFMNKLNTDIFIFVMGFVHRCSAFNKRIE